MPWSYEINATLQIVEVLYEGDISERELRESNSELIGLQQDKGLNRFLVDATEVKLASSLMVFYDLPTKQYIEEQADRLSRVAILPPTDPDAREAARFYETVCRNRGWLVQVFSERQEAVDWMTGPGGSEHG
jgi:hypothetical protein